MRGRAYVIERLMGPAALKHTTASATESDLLALPQQGRGFELVAGELVEKQAGFRHGRAQFSLAGLLSPYRRSGGGGERPGGWWFATEQLVSFAASQVLRPDVAGWLRDRLDPPPEDDDAIVRLRPDWVCEIISPRKAAHDLVRKKRIYHHHEVPFYWIVDPRDESLTVLQWTAKGYLEIIVAQSGERVRAEPFAAVELQVGVLFGEDEDEGAKSSRRRGRPGDCGLPFAAVRKYGAAGRLVQRGSEASCPLKHFQTKPSWCAGASSAQLLSLIHI